MLELLRGIHRFHNASRSFGARIPSSSSIKQIKKIEKEKNFTTTTTTTTKVKKKMKSCTFWFLLGFVSPPPNKVNSCRLIIVLTSRQWHLIHTVAMINSHRYGFVGQTAALQPLLIVLVHSGSFWLYSNGLPDIFRYMNSEIPQPGTPFTRNRHILSWILASHSQPMWNIGDSSTSTCTLHQRLALKFKFESNG